MLSRVEGLDGLLAGGGPGLEELRRLVGELLGGPGTAGRLTGCRQLGEHVHRVSFEAGGGPRSLVVKRLDADTGRRNQLAAQRWLPAVGLGGSGPPLLGVAADPAGAYVWHAYEDLGGDVLDESAPDPAAVAAAVDLVAQVHTRFAGHPLLAECRLRGGDRGAAFYSSQVRDARLVLEALRPPRVGLGPGEQALRDRLLGHLDRLLAEEPRRVQALRDWGGPETLLHGDLWPKNVLLVPAGAGVRARLIDWDRAAVGPVSYDLSTLLSRFPGPDRDWVLGRYREAVGRHGWRLPPPEELNLLFEAAEAARVASSVIWPALAVWEGPADWAFEDLALADEWFGRAGPLLPAGGGAPA